MEDILTLLNKGVLSSQAGVSDETRAILASEDFTEIVTFPQDTVIIKQRTRPDALYFTICGVFHAISNANPNASHRLLGKIDAGQFMGEVCVVDPNGKASATVKAMKDSMALKMQPNAFDLLREKHPQAAFEFLLAVARQLAKRLRDANERTL